MPETNDRRTATRLSYDEVQTARLRLHGQECMVLDVGRTGVRYELPSLPVRPSANASFEGELELVCGELVPVFGTVVRSCGCVAAARLDRAVLTDIQLAREREFIRHLTRAQRAAGDERRRWRSIPDVHVPFEPRRSEA